jgi:hypothetical protein
MGVRFNSNLGPVFPRDPLEAHYTLKQIAEKWGCDDETVRQTFIDEDGVLILGEQTRNDGKRAYLTIRVPESVLNRVYAERTKRQFQVPKRRITIRQPRAKQPDSKSTAEDDAA